VDDVVAYLQTGHKHISAAHRAMSGRNRPFTSQMRMPIWGISVY